MGGTGFASAWVGGTGFASVDRAEDPPSRNRAIPFSLTATGIKRRGMPGASHQFAGRHQAHSSSGTTFRQTKVAIIARCPFLRAAATGLSWKKGCRRDGEELGELEDLPLGQRAIAGQDGRDGRLRHPD